MLLAGNEFGAEMYSGATTEEQACLWVAQNRLRRRQASAPLRHRRTRPHLPDISVKAGKEHRTPSSDEALALLAACGPGLRGPDASGLPRTSGEVPARHVGKTNSSRVQRVLDDPAVLHDHDEIFCRVP